jgi:hypothetical protein
MGSFLLLFLLEVDSNNLPPAPDMEESDMQSKNFLRSYLTLDRIQSTSFSS